MLQFFRRYQKIFFIFITVIIVISFSFFGTFTTFQNQEEISDREIGKAVDGSRLHFHDLEMMKRFLKNNYEDDSRAANLLNDSLVYKNFLLSDMGLILAERYFDWIKADLQERIRAAKSFSGYVHPQAPSINALEVWANYHPKTKILLEELKAANESQPTIRDFSILCQLYLAQSEFPPHILKQILLYQQSQYSWIKPDPALYHQQLNLFNFHSIEDWFGPRFLDLLSQFVINAAIIAEQKGYHVTKEEARAELILNVYRLLQSEQREKQITLKDAQNYYFQQLAYLGMDEDKVIKTWQKIAYFRRMFEEAGKGTFIDTLALDQIYSHSKEMANVETYQMQRPLHLRDFRSLLKFQLYLEAVSGKENKGSLLNLPETFLSAEDIEKHFPELIQKRFLLEISEVKKDQLAMQVPLKETWDWELDEQHFNLCRKEFPSLANTDAKTRAQRDQALEKLEGKERAKIDQFARLKMMEAHPEWLLDALARAESRKEVIAIQMQGESFQLQGITDKKEFLKLLEKEDHLPQFTGDGNIYYSIRVLERSKEKEILTFEEANQRGILDELLDQHLEAAYPAVRKKQVSKFSLEDGSWKPFEEVKNQIGQILYKDLLQAIEKSCYEEIDFSSISSLDLYATHRFCHHMNQALDLLKNSTKLPLLSSEPEEKDAWVDRKPLETQWLLAKTNEKIRHQNEQSVLLDPIFQLNEGQWSKVLAKPRGDISFYRLIEKTKAGLSDQEISDSQKALSLEAQRYLMKQILDDIATKDAIHLAQNDE